MSRFACLLTLAGVLALSGCSGARVGIVAETIDAPVSLTSAVYDENGGILLEGQHLEVVGKFEHGISTANRE